MNKEQKKNYFLWAALLSAYAIFILVFCILRPYGMDEIRSGCFSVSDIFTRFIAAYTTENTRIGVVFNNILLYFGKWSFCLINPFVQLLIVFQIYGLIFLRLPDFKTLKDFFTFAFIMLCSIFAVAQPDNTIFWMNGACSYSWLIPCFLFLLTLLRLYTEKGLILHNSFWTKAGIFAAAFCTGMSNENSAPASFAIFILFAAVCLYKKIKLPFWYWWALAGIMLGLAALFGAPGLYNRLNYWAFEDFRHASASDKMFMHLSRMNDFFVLTFLIPIINSVGLYYQSRDSKKLKELIKNKNFIYSTAFMLMGFILAFVLYKAPQISLRVFYSASVFSIIGFIFFIEYLNDTYKIDIYKYLLPVAAAFALIALPRFTLPYVNLYRQNSARNAQIEQTKKENKKVFYAQKFYILEGPTENLSIEYYDYINPLSLKKAEQYYGIQFEEINKSNSVSPVTKNI